MTKSTNEKQINPLVAELLAATKFLSAQLRKRECSIRDCRAIDQADAAIAKAEGGAT